MKNGFTLAEVLITLGIIGVVAALTIPTLFSNYQDRAWETSASVFTKKLKESLKVMNSQQTLAGHKNTESFVNELSKHFKIINICKNEELQNCFSKTVYWGADSEEVDMTNVLNASHFGQKDWKTDIVGVQFANGTNGLIAYNPDCTENPYDNQTVVTDCMAILYDTTGFKAPNTDGKDMNSINVVSLGGNPCAAEIDGVCFGKAFMPTPAQGFFEDDYIAGAKLMCQKQGGTLISFSELTNLVNKLYNTSRVVGSTEFIEDEIYENLAINSELASALGINYSSAPYVALLSSQTNNGEFHLGWIIKENSVAKLYDWTTDNSAYAICSF